MADLTRHPYIYIYYTYYIYIHTRKYTYIFKNIYIYIYIYKKVCVCGMYLGRLDWTYMVWPVQVALMVIVYICIWSKSYI